MKVTTSKWFQPGTHDIGHFCTSITIRTDSVVCGVTIPGHFTRKEAIKRCAQHLQAENRWSPSFINQLYDLCR